LVQGRALDLSWILSELDAQTVTYGYLLLSTSIVFVLLGYLLGSQEDLLLQSSITDPLTDLFNRRHVQDRLREELASAERHGQPLALLLIDLDGLKEINDRWGHEAGDAALCAVARSLQTGCRITDVAARLGGDEFVVLAPFTTADEALRLADRIRSILEGQCFEESGLPMLSVSIGVADSTEGDGERPEALYAAADKALYAAKAKGRNRAVYAAQ
jgi:diguanylate cyclase (GGDEF)-like protein